eukprot:532308_1
MTTVSGITEMQLIEPGAGLSAEDASFTLTTTSWQRNKISFYHESIAYTILCFYIGVFITLILLALMYHHIIYEIVGVIGCLLTLLLCVLYYIKHCFGVFFKYENKVIFNESTNNIEIHRNNEFIAQIGFNEFDGLSYADHYVYLNIKQGNNEYQKEPIPLNIYRCDPKRAKEFVLMVTDIWILVKKKYQRAVFQPIHIS